MTPKPAQITASAIGNHATIVIDGYITAETSTHFDEVFDKLIAGNVTSVDLKLNSLGGSVFVANKIANKLKSLPGTVNCDIIAVCASAATYIALACKERTMPKNGQFMIHKPMSAFKGNEDEMKAEMKLLSSLTKSYRKTYADITGMSESDIEDLCARLKQGGK